MNISPSSGGYADGQLRGLLARLLHQAKPTGQNPPTGASSDTNEPPPAPPAGSEGDRFATQALGTLLSAQETGGGLADHIVKTVDANGDSVLNLDEISGALGAASESLQQAFNQLDTNQDGSLGVDELTAGLKAMHGHRHHHHHADAGQASNTDLASQLTGAADTDGDGSLSLGEIGSALGASDTSGLASGFAKLDSNGDGKLSSAELASALEALRQARGYGASTQETADATAGTTA